MLRWAMSRLWWNITTLIGHWNEDECSWRSAAVAFYGAFSLFPVCLMTLAGLGIVARHSDAVQSGQAQLIELIEESSSPWMAQQVGQVLSQIRSDAGIGGPVGIGALLIAAIGIFLQIDATLDRIWHGPAQPSGGFWRSVRNLLVNRLVAFLLMLGLGVVLAVVLIANLSLSSFEQYLGDSSAALFLWQALQRALTPLIYMLVFLLIYRFMPKAKVLWWHAWQGAILAAVAWWLGQLGLQWVLVGDHYSAYGVVGAFMGILVWLYYSSAALFLGAELVRLRGQQMREREEAKSRPPK
ncbi:MAG: YihY/virulence factor BrkB family protein [Planctomycetes bacterium]|nr:YihY/virulence factor BrkB family protein [Planctomycetota bacterium]